MMALGLHPTSATYTLLIEAYATEGDVEGAHKIFNSIVKADAAAWNAVLRAHAGIGDLTGLGQTFQLMVDQHEGNGNVVIPDESTYITCFEGIATALRKHTSMLESISAISGGSGGGSGDAEQHSSNTGGVEAKKVAMDVLHQVEQHMKKSKTSSTITTKPAVRAALVKAHGALHHTALVWSLLADEYIYNQMLSSGKTTRKNNRIVIATSSGGAEGAHLPVAVYHALPPKPKCKSSSSELETELLQALSTATSSSKATDKSATYSFFPPRVLNAGIPQLCRAGRVDLVIQLLNNLPKSGYCIDSDTYAAIIGACAGSLGHSGSHHSQLQVLRPTFARRLLSHMEELHEKQQYNTRNITNNSTMLSLLKPCSRVYNALLRVECARGGVNAALDIIEEMKNKAIEPDSHTWMVLRGCALSNGRNDVAEQANYEIQILKSGGGGSEKRLARRSGLGEEIETGEGAAVVSQATTQEEERHWKGYYASDEEDEW
jgi:pentatricopeptide repeat protein